MVFQLLRHQVPRNRRGTRGRYAREKTLAGRRLEGTAAIRAHQGSRGAERAIRQACQRGRCPDGDEATQREGSRSRPVTRPPAGRDGTASAPRPFPQRKSLTQLYGPESHGARERPEQSQEERECSRKGYTMSPSPAARALTI